MCLFARFIAQYEESCVAAFLRSDIAGESRSDLKFKHIEGINIELK